ncbi:ABC transporter ATP-binding protein [Thermopolyspora flexuosa]|uniref:ABC-2 type transport system ATP-binding protein n=1 Tax=Thermopolyspora flexuosa TaxID=103836 RepID=A0A543J379_9ACTN|nr:ATP-binding cassette domain-containing protein [Thermopolyspora flexuosa]PZN41422.1 MAG: lantibiotic ABC transporter ATP-binding protein [Actinomycetota bacterium]TQM77264.1 ABC-2 type transport system ATP-binding protein [Thermopolyspora flexuosa]GGM74765.1 ABC transporter ATP-binding protein [Thermopolyspora flexuosa]
MAALEIRDLHKHYDGFRALDGANLTVPEGSLYGLLGPNGAGKTTLMKSVAGLRRPNSGRIHLFGRPLERRLLTQVGALLESPGLWAHLDAVAHLRIHARLRGVPQRRIDEVLELVKLTEVRSRKVAKYSLGMRWRLGIAIALLGRPRLVVLDEPMNGLDPVGIRDMRATLRSLAETGTTVMISSHQLAEVSQVCDQVGVLVAGRTAYEGPLHGLAVDGDLEEGFFRLLEQAGSDVR